VRERKKTASEWDLNRDASVDIFSRNINYHLERRLSLTAMTAPAKHSNLSQEGLKKWDSGGYQEEKDLM
jgi:hypothetical protein